MWSDFAKTYDSQQKNIRLMQPSLGFVSADTLPKSVPGRLSIPGTKQE
jgi:hypothetical protein